MLCVLCKLAGGKDRGPLIDKYLITPKGVPHPTWCNARATHEVPSSKLKEQPPHRKIGVTSNLPVGRISVVTLIRTDTTLDHSQKAEKV